MNLAAIIEVDQLQYVVVAAGADVAGALVQQAEAAADAAEAAAITVAGQIQSVGNRIGELSRITRLYNSGAAKPFGTNGFKITSGTSGLASTFQPRWFIDGAAEAGRTIKFIYGFTQSATFTRSFSIGMQVDTAGGAVNRSSVITNTVTGNRRIVTLTYAIQGDEEEIIPFFTIASAGNTASDETFTLTDFVPVYQSTESDVNTTADDTEVALADFQARDQLGKLFSISMGDQLASSTIVRSLSNGATNLAASGLTIPSASTGASSFIQCALPFAGAEHTGRTVRIVAAFDLSGTFTRDMTAAMQVVLTDTSSASRDSIIRRKVSGTRMIFTIDYELQGDEVTLQPVFSVGGVATTSNETITLTQFFLAFSASGRDYESANDASLDYKLARSPAYGFALAYGRIPSLTQPNVVTVAPTGADYTNVIAAIAGVGPVPVSERTKIDIAAGTYATAEVFDADYVDLTGYGVVLDGSQPDAVSAPDISNNSTMFVRKTTRLEGLDIRIKNGRYAIHLESSNVFEDRVQEIISCKVRHFGNDSAVNSAAWGSQFAIGSGVSSGQVVKLRDSYIWAKNHAAFSYHTNLKFENPSMVDAEGCTFAVDDSAGYAFQILPLGSFRPDKCRLVGNVFGGDIYYGNSPWLPTALIDQPADHCEVSVYGHGNTPAVFVNGDFGEALRIDSATTGGSSSVAISGTAVKAIFGDGTNDKYTTRAGSAGFSGAVWGWGDISTVAVGPSQNVQTKSLGQRLGNCTSANKTLSVVVNGGAPIVITFNLNYTASTNATIIAAINAALGSAATASVYKPGSFYRPRFSDEEFAPRNTGTVGLPFGTVCAFNGSDRSVRAMTSADSASLFGGVALQDIPVGTSGRVKKAGYVLLTDILRVDSASIAYGDTFSIDGANPGKITKGGAQGLFPAIRSNAVRIK